MRFRRKEKEPEEENITEPVKEKRREKIVRALKYAGTGVAVIAGGIAAAALAALTASARSDESKEVSYDPNAFDRYYEPFADPDNPLYIEPDNVIDVDWDEDLDYGVPDESYGAEDYYESRPWTDE